VELKITGFFNGAAPMDYSASVAEIGRTAGADTWRAACDDAPDWNLLDTDEKREAFREFVSGYGAWTDEEIAAWDNTHLNALCLQWISGDMREVPDVEMGPNMSADDWATYQKYSEAGIVAGRFFQSGTDVYWTME